MLCPYPVGVAAGQRLKYEQYLDDWQRAGYAVTVSPFISLPMWDILYRPANMRRKAWGTLKGFGRRIMDLFRIRDYNIVYVHMWVTPFRGNMFERLTRWLARNLIYDIEDNLLAREPGIVSDSPHPVLRFLKSQTAARYLLREADQVIVASDFLQQAYLPVNRARRVALIPPSLDVDRFRPAAVAASERNGGVVTIGWTGTFSSKPFLDALRPVWKELRKVADFRLIVIGNFDYNLDDVSVEVVRWDRNAEVEQLLELDIGIYPLPNDDWAKGKAGLKIIQYQAVGIPCVASHAGLSPFQISEGKTGFLVSNDAEWLNRLQRLLQDSDLRRRMGAAARSNAVQRYSREAIAGQYRAILAQF
ncbi:MAG: glycosyltransferase family 4 protein [Sphingomonadaceae bacterium]|nr:glycosyltransferase family 4 protein [Sphingomonadaceae bacterium]